MKKSLSRHLQERQSTRKILFSENLKVTIPVCLISKRSSECSRSEKPRGNFSFNQFSSWFSRSVEEDRLVFRGEEIIVSSSLVKIWRNLSDWMMLSPSGSNLFSKWTCLKKKTRKICFTFAIIYRIVGVELYNRVAWELCVVDLCKLLN